MYISERLEVDPVVLRLSDIYLKSSTLVQAIRNGINVSKIQDPQTNQLIYGNLNTRLPDDINLRLAQNILGFRDVLGLRITTQELDAILLYILKTDQDPFSLVEETVYEILENERPLWLSAVPLNEPVEFGTITCIIGLPAVGKTWLAQTKFSRSWVVLDDDQFRFNVLGPFIYKADNSILGEDLWTRSQHLYGPEIDKIYQLCYRATAQWLKLEGLNVVTTSLAACDETDRFILLNPNELEGILKEPSPENLEPLLSGDIRANLLNAGFPAFAALYKTVRERVHRRARRRGEKGSVNVSSPCFEPLPVRQTIGANPKLDDKSIAKIIDWLRRDILSLRNSGVVIDELCVTEARRNYTPPPVREPTEKSFGSHNRIIPTDTLIRERESVIDQNKSAMARILKLSQRYVSTASELREPVSAAISKAIEIDNPNLKKAVVYTLLKELTLKDNVLTWPTREEVRVKKGNIIIEPIPHPLHSAAGIPKLGELLTGRFDILDWLVSLAHDQFEVASDYRRNKEIGGSSVLREEWNDDVLRLWPETPLYGQSMQISASLLTERVSAEQRNRIRQLVEPLYRDSDSLASQYLRLTKEHGMRDEELARTGRIGPTSYTYLGLKYKHIADIERLGYKDLARAILKVALMDRFEDVISLPRYFARDLTPRELRFKLLSYTGRLLASLSKLREVFVELDRETQRELADAFRTFTPLMFDILEVTINPRLEMLGLFPISRDEVFTFYWEHRVPVVKELEEVLRDIASEHAEHAISVLCERH